jgi:serine protease
VAPPPRIDIAPGVIDFGAAISQQDLFLTVIGEGKVTQVGTSTSGESWLTLSSATQINPYTVRFTATVNRDLVAPGAYSGTLTFRGVASGESLNTVNVPVYFNKPAVTLLGNAGTQYALLIDSESLNTINESPPFQTKENASAYSITGVKKGSYYIVAGTDIDNNNFICEEGEICSFYEVNTGESEEIVVNGPVTKVALKAEVLQGVSTQAASAGNSAKAGGSGQLGISRNGAVSAAAVERLLRSVGGQGGVQVSDAVVLGRQ